MENLFMEDSIKTFEFYVIPYDCWNHVLSNFEKLEDYNNLCSSIPGLWRYIHENAPSDYLHRLSVLPNSERRSVRNLFVSNPNLRSQSKVFGNSLKKISKFSPNLRSLTVDQPLFSELKDNEMLEIAHSRIESLSFSTDINCHLNLDCSSLQKLELKTSKNKQLTILEYNLSDKFDTLYLTGWSLQASLYPLKGRLETLKLHQVNLLQKEDLQNWPKLRNLTLSGISLLSRIESLEYFDFPLLEKLEILVSDDEQDQNDLKLIEYDDRMKPLGFRKITKFRNLRVLNIDLAITIDVQGFFLEISHLPQLRRLQAKNVEISFTCSDHNDFCCSLPHLSVLSLENCLFYWSFGGQSFSENSSPKLEELRVENCEVICQNHSFIACVPSIFSESLKSLVLRDGIDSFLMLSGSNSNNNKNTKILEVENMKKLENLRLVTSSDRYFEQQRPKKEAKEESDSTRLLSYILGGRGQRQEKQTSLWITRSILNCPSLRSVEVNVKLSSELHHLHEHTPFPFTLSELPKLESLVLNVYSYDGNTKIIKIEDLFMYIGWVVPSLRKLSIVDHQQKKGSGSSFVICFHEYFMNEVEELELSGFNDIHIDGNTFSELTKIKIHGNHFEKIHINNHEELEKIEILGEEEDDQQFVTITHSLIISGLPALEGLDLGKVVAGELVLLENLPKCTHLTLNTFMDTQHGFTVENVENLFDMNILVFPKDSLMKRISQNDRRLFEFVDESYFFLEEKYFPLIWKLGVTVMNESCVVVEQTKKDDNDKKKKDPVKSMPLPSLKKEYKPIDRIKGLINLNQIELRYKERSIELITPFRMITSMNSRNVNIQVGENVFSALSQHLSDRFSISKPKREYRLDRFIEAFFSKKITKNSFV